MSVILLRVFTWANTPEGYAFWERVHTKIFSPTYSLKPTPNKKPVYLSQAMAIALDGAIEDWEEVGRTGKYHDHYCRLCNVDDYEGGYCSGCPLSKDGRLGCQSYAFNLFQIHSTAWYGSKVHRLAKVYARAFAQQLKHIRKRVVVDL